MLGDYLLEIKFMIERKDSQLFVGSDLRIAIYNLLKSPFVPLAPIEIVTYLLGTYLFSPVYPATALM